MYNENHQIIIALKLVFKYGKCSFGWIKQSYCSVWRMHIWRKKNGGWRLGMGLVDDIGCSGDCNVVISNRTDSNNNIFFRYSNKINPISII